MKLAKLSLVAVTVAGLSASAFGADTLADAFKDGKVNGMLKSYYISHPFDDATKADKDGFAVGGILKYTTGDFKGFKAGIGFQTSHTLGFDSSIAAENDTTVSIQETMLSEAYLDYKLNKTTARVGRTFIKTPLVSNSNSRMIKDYFTGLVVTDNSFTNTTIMAAAITDWTTRNNVTAHLDNPVYTVYGKTKVAGFGLEAQVIISDSKVAGTEDSTKDYYIEATYAIPMDTPITIGAQYMAYDTETYDSSMYGAKIETKVADFKLGAYYNSTDDEGEVMGGYGTGKDPSYNDLYTIDGRKANTDSYQGMVSYDFANAGVKGLKAMTRYAVYNDYGVVGTDANSLDMDVSYAFSGSLKGLSTQVIYAMTDIDGNKGFDELRVKLNYKF